MASREGAERSGSDMSVRLSWGESWRVLLYHRCLTSDEFATQLELTTSSRRSRNSLIPSGWSEEKRERNTKSSSSNFVACPTLCTTPTGT